MSESFRVSEYYFCYCTFKALAKDIQGNFLGMSCVLHPDMYNHPPLFIKKLGLNKITNAVIFQAAQIAFLTSFLIHKE